MPDRIPSYRHHKPSGQAVVTLNGRDHYLGPHGTDVSRANYDRLVSRWIAGGRSAVRTEPVGITLAELYLRYLDFANGYYVKNGRPTKQIWTIRNALKAPIELYGEKTVASFTPTCLKAIREVWLLADVSRGLINRRVRILRQIFRWGVEHELVPVATYQTLATIRGLIKGRTTARELPRVLPVPLDHVERTLAVLREPVATMVRLQLATGMRPGEVCQMRAGDIDRSGDVWVYSPASHKSEHHGRERPIYLGPTAQRAIDHLIDCSTGPYLFPGLKKPGPMRVDVYGKTIAKACREASVPRWSPNRLRHTYATMIRRVAGLDAAQVMLGHASANVTQVYAELDEEKGRDVARRFG